MYLYLFSCLFAYAHRHCVAVLVAVGVGVVANVTRTDKVGTDDPAIAVVPSPNDAVLVLRTYVPSSSTGLRHTFLPRTPSRIPATKPFYGRDRNLAATSGRWSTGLSVFSPLKLPRWLAFFSSLNCYHTMQKLTLLYCKQSIGQTDDHVAICAVISNNCAENGRGPPFILCTAVHMAPTVLSPTSDGVTITFPEITDSSENSHTSCE